MATCKILTPMSKDSI